MIRRYCDICETEIESGEVDNAAIVTYEAKHGPETVRLAVRITRAVNGVSNGGHVCAECLKRAIWDGLWGRTTSDA